MLSAHACGAPILTTAVLMFTAMSAVQFWKSAPSIAEEAKAFVDVVSEYSFHCRSHAAQAASCNTEASISGRPGAGWASTCGRQCGCAALGGGSGSIDGNHGDGHAQARCVRNHQAQSSFLVTVTITASAQADTTVPADACGLCDDDAPLPVVAIEDVERTTTIIELLEKIAKQLSWRGVACTGSSLHMKNQSWRENRIRSSSMCT